MTARCVYVDRQMQAASRTSSIFLANPTVSTTSQIERLGCRWLSRRGFARAAGTIAGTAGPPAWT